MTNHAAPVNLHHVNVKHERDTDGDIVHTDLTFECRGDIASKCHVYPSCECENWGSLYCSENHPRVPHSECWLTPWFDGGLDWTPYDGPEDREYLTTDLPERSGPIVFDFDECILWRWADDAALGLTPTTPNQEQNR